MPAYDMLDAMVRYELPGSGLTFKLSVKDAVNRTYIFARRPDGIQVGGYRQVLLGVRWDWDAKPMPER
jgi:hypothetical protein